MWSWLYKQVYHFPVFGWVVVHALAPFPPPLAPFCHLVDRTRWKKPSHAACAPRFMSDTKCVSHPRKCYRTVPWNLIQSSLLTVTPSGQCYTISRCHSTNILFDLWKANWECIGNKLLWSCSFNQTWFFEAWKELWLLREFNQRTCTAIPGRNRGEWKRHWRRLKPRNRSVHSGEPDYRG